MVVQLVAARPAPLEPRPRRSTRRSASRSSAGRHPVEVAVAEHLAARVGVGRDASRPRSPRPRRRPRSTWMPEPARAPSSPRRWPSAALVGGPRARPPRRLGSADVEAIRPAVGAACGRAGARSGRRRGRRSPGRRAAGRTRPHRRRGPIVPLPDVDEAEGAGEVDRRAEVDVQPRRPERPPEPDRLREQPPSVDVLAGRREQDRRAGGIGHRRRQAPAACLGEVATGRRAADLADVLLVLEDDAERLVDEVSGDSSRGAQGQERCRPVERLRDARNLGQVGRRGGGGRRPRRRGPALPGRPARARRRSRTPWPRTGSRSSGRGSGA